MYTFSSFMPFSSFNAKGDVQRRAEGLAFALGFERAQLGFADLVVAEVEGRLVVVTLDGEDFLEDRLEAAVFAAC